MGMTEHEAILQLKDITQVFQAEDREEVDQMFYNQLTLDEIRDNLQEFNCLIGEIKQILREVEDGRVDNVRGNRATELLEHISALFTKEEVIALLTELKTEIHIMSDTVVEGKTVTITSWEGMQKRICKLIEQKINELKADQEE